MVPQHSLCVSVMLWCIVLVSFSLVWMPRHVHGLILVAFVPGTCCPQPTCPNPLLSSC